ncbi:UPF0149 family protein [Teredinibacter franksiae]|jgi:Uncharacterized protein conserved in bacteria|uniref:UPF0149 family protein n=1 Tax=Teredinibacter franksiae TaxID=2761453 RepID=UPI001623B084|nr:UPF0149 family protein [Teredinibacter franksiae]
MSGLFEFHFINDQLMNMGSVNSAAELQGLLCGRLSAGEDLTAAQWQEIALEYLELDYITPNEEHQALFLLLLEHSGRLLKDDEYVFQPLLPDDHASMDHRARELSGWCEGYLHGLGQAIGKAGLGEGDKLPDEVADALRDMAHITQADVGAEGDMDAEENEVYWTELVEYVKVAVLTVYTELTGAKASKSEPATVADLLKTGQNNNDKLH